MSELCERCGARFGKHATEQGLLCGSCLQATPHTWCLSCATVKVGDTQREADEKLANHHRLLPHHAELVGATIGTPLALR